MLSVLLGDGAATRGSAEYYYDCFIASLYTPQAHQFSGGLHQTPWRRAHLHPALPAATTAVTIHASTTRKWLRICWARRVSQGFYGIRWVRILLPPRAFSIHRHAPAGRTKRRLRGPSSNRLLLMRPTSAYLRLAQIVWQREPTLWRLSFGCVGLYDRLFSATTSSTGGAALLSC